MLQRPQLVDAGDDAQAAVLLGRFVDVDGHRDQVVVRVGKERVVLVPLEARMVAGGRLEIELRVMDLDVRSDEGFDGVEDLRVEDQVHERLVMGDRVEDAADVAFAGRGQRERELRRRRERVQPAEV